MSSNNLPLQNKTIKLADVQQKLTKTNSTRVSITDEHGDKYSFFSTKQDGSSTKAFETFQGLKLGDEVEIGYTEEEKEYEGKKYTARTIKIFTRE